MSYNNATLGGSAREDNFHLRPLGKETLSQNVAAQKISAPPLRKKVKNILPAFLLHVEVVDFLLFIVGWS